MTVADTLKKAPLFAEMDEKAVSFFAAHSHRKKFKKGEILFSIGEPAPSFFFIETGWIKVYRVNRDGAESVINVFGPGDTFAEAAVFSPLQRYPANAQAVEDTDLIEIPRKAFMEKIGTESDVAFSVLNAISSRHRHLVQQIEQLTSRDAPQRLGFFFLRLCPPGEKKDISLTLPYDKSLIARCLNIQPETLSRSMKKLESYGVTSDGKTIRIRDIESLTQFCDVDDRNDPL